MTEKPVNGATSIHDRIHAEMLDSLDEELELEIDDHRLDQLTSEFPITPPRRRSIAASTSRSCSACRENW